MTTLGDLVTIVQNTIYDQLEGKPVFYNAIGVSNVIASDIVKYLNIAVKQIAAGVMVPGFNVPTEPLPDLYVIGTVLTGADSYVDLPDNYGRCLQFAMNSNNIELKIYENLISLIRKFPDNDYGNVAGVAIKGNTIHYRRTPTMPETLTIHYHRKPVDMLVDTDEPDGIPYHLQEALLCNFAIMEVAKRIKDMTHDVLSLYETFFYRAVSDLNGILQHDVDHESFLR